MPKTPVQFDDLVVDAGLVALRDQAGNGDYDAMIQLANRLIDHDGVTPNVQVLERIACTLFDAAKEQASLKRLIAGGNISSHVYRLKWEKQMITYDHYYFHVSEILATLIGTMSTAPANQWDLPLMREYLDWMIEMKPQPATGSDPA